MFTSQKILETSVAAIATATLQGRIAYVNRAFVTLWRHSDASEVLGRSVLSFWTDRDRAADVLSELTKRGEWRGELVGKRVDGSEFTTLLQAAVVSDTEGRPVAITASFIDRTEEVESARVNRGMADILRSVREAVIVTDLAGTIRYWNEGAEKLFGHRRSYITGRFIGEVMNPGEPERQREQLEQILNAGTMDRRRRLVRPDGIEIWVDDHVSVLRDVNGNASGFVGVVFDVTAEVEKDRQREELLSRMTLLRRMDRDILLAEDPERIADAALGWLMEAVSCKRASVVLFHKDTNRPYLFRQRSACSTEALAETAKLSPTLFGPDPLNPRRGINIVRNVGELIRRDPHIRQIYELGVGAYANIPMIVHERIIGYLNIGSSDDTLFTERVISTCEEVASSLALVIEHSVVVEESQRLAQRIRSLSQHRIEIQNEERSRFARLLHDLVGNNLSLLAIQVSRLRRRIGPGEDNRFLEEIGELSETISRTAASIREITDQLHPSTLQALALVAALREHCAQLSRRIGAEIGFIAGREVVPMDEGAQTEAYLASIELISNSVKHSRATLINVIIDRAGSHLLIVVADNGTGFDYDAIQNRIVDKTSHSGWGLINVKERIEAMGGTLNVSTTPGEGCTTTIRLPLEEPAGA
ncbi:PAS domain S-box protein [Salinispira pacifica]